MRDERDKARQNFHWALDLQRQLQAFKGKGKSGAIEHTRGTGSKAAVKGKRKGKQVIPKSWADMKGSDKWYLQQLWDGILADEKESTESMCRSSPQAKDFAVSDDDWIEC